MGVVDDGEAVVGSVLDLVAGTQGASAVAHNFMAAPLNVTVICKLRKDATVSCARISGVFSSRT